MPFSGTRSRFPWTYNNNRGSSPTKAKDRQIFQKSEISTIQVSTSTIYRIFDLLSKLHCQNDSLRFFNYSKQRMPGHNSDHHCLQQKTQGKNEALDRCCQLALREPLPGKQFVLMSEASSEAAGYAVLIEDNPTQKYTSTRKTYAPIANASKIYTPSQIKMSIHANEFSAIYLAFKKFGHIFWGANKTVIIMTNSRSVTRFFSNKNDSTTFMERVRFCTAN